MTFRKEDSVAVIALNRPDRGNSLTINMHRAMRAIWEDIRTDDSIKACVITGQGNSHFCTGIDVNRVAETGHTTTGGGPLSQELYWTSRLNNVWKPTICVVNGLVAGAGLHFVADADIVLAAPHASFLDAHVNVGMVGGVENVGLLARAPLGAVLQMTLMGREHKLSAERAQQVGLVDEVLSAELLTDRAFEIAATIAKNSPSAVERSMQSIWAAVNMWASPPESTPGPWLELNRAHPDFAEGPRSFAERRPPAWRPRDA